jgi:glucose/mannose-6-phosphate isomerase
VSGLSREAVAAVDRDGMLDDVLAQPAHLGDAVWRAHSAGVPRADAPGGLAVCAVGGSAIGGDIAVAAIGPRAVRPIRSVRGYALESWTRDDTLVVCASYSGDTEETVACYEAARALGAPRVAVTTGGRLGELAREDGVPVIGVPGGMQPRASFVYVAVAVMWCAAACGAAPDLSAEAEATAGPLGGLAEAWGPDAPADSEAKSLAATLKGTVPVIHGAELTVPAAFRWKCELNENAGAAAFWSVLPEADHNELCAWEDAAGHAVSAVFLEDEEQHPRVRRRMELTARMAAEAGAAPVERIQSRGGSRLERLLSLVMLGDLVSVYAAVLAGVDPTPVEPIERFKADLG